MRCSCARSLIGDALFTPQPSFYRVMQSKLHYHIINSRAALALPINKAAKQSRALEGKPSKLRHCEALHCFSRIIGRLTLASNRCMRSCFAGKTMLVSTYFITVAQQDSIRTQDTCQQPLRGSVMSTTASKSYIPFMPVETGASNANMPSHIVSNLTATKPRLLPEYASREKMHLVAPTCLRNSCMQ